ncbi:MAG: beta strand repeat-containing protein, partial [Ferruginibacter sp.]
NASGTISVTSSLGSTTSSSSYTNLGYISNASTDWNTTTTWLGSAVPPAAATVTIVHAVTVNGTVTNNPNTVTINASSSLTFGASGALGINTSLTNNGTLAWTTSGTLTMAASSTLTNNATFTRGTGTINFSGAGTINGSAAITLNNLTINTGVLTLTTVPTIAGTFTINNGNVSTAPIYTNTSTLFYNVSYNRFNEWNASGIGTIGSTPGYPNHVTINTGTFDIVNGVAGTARACAGTLTVNNGAIFNFNAFAATFTAGNGVTINTGAVMNANTLSGAFNVTGNVATIGSGSLNMGSMTSDLTVTGSISNGGTLTQSSSSGSDIFVTGDFNNTGGAFNNSGRAVNLIGTGTQTLSGTLNGSVPSNCFAFLIINKASGGVTLSTPVNVSNVLTLTQGIVTTTTTNILTITATGTGGISGGSTTAYVSGPLARAIPANLASGSTYVFPVGKGGTYYPLSAVNPTSGASAPTLTVEAFNSNPGGSADASLSSVSTTEYWSLAATGNFNGTSVSLTRQIAIGSFNTIGNSTSAAGTYTNIGGTVAS